MTDFELDQRARQRVMEFLSYRPEQPATTNAEAQGCATDVSDAPISIAQQTAADLMRFLSNARE